MNQINVTLDAFKGPLDLLLHLIEKNEIDIYDIPIAVLTEQYMEYIGVFSSNDIDQLSEFLVMAATLLEIKSKMLLPEVQKDDGKNEGEFIDPREELMNRLIEYKRYKEVVPIFSGKAELAEKFLTKAPEYVLIDMLKNEGEIELEKILKNISLDGLFKVFNATIKRKALKTDVVRSGFSSITKDTYTIEEKMEYILNMIYLNGEISFIDLFLERATKVEIVVTFLAMLELSKLNKILLMQDDLFTEILIVGVKS